MRNALKGSKTMNASELSPMIPKAAGTGQFIEQIFCHGCPVQQDLEQPAPFNLYSPVSFTDHGSSNQADEEPDGDASDLMPEDDEDDDPGNDNATTKLDDIDEGPDGDDDGGDDGLVGRSEEDGVDDAAPDNVENDAGDLINELETDDVSDAGDEAGDAASDDELDATAAADSPTGEIEDNAVGNVFALSGQAYEGDKDDTNIPDNAADGDELDDNSEIDGLTGEIEANATGNVAAHSGQAFEGDKDDTNIPDSGGDDGDDGFNADNPIEDDAGMVDESQTGLPDDDDDIESDLVEGDR